MKHSHLILVAPAIGTARPPPGSLMALPFSLGMWKESAAVALTLKEGAT
jgi:hypothetical protein